MSKDYKNVPREHEAAPAGTGGVLPFVTGLVVGLFAALLVFLNFSDLGYRPFQGPAQAPAETTDAAGAGTGDAAAEKESPPAPRFDFYNILPNKEINISEWIAEEPAVTAPPGEDKEGVYILQVGSFKQPEAADQVKAQLALLGIRADIQRVVINGQDARYRVRVGPYRDQDILNEERRRLQENNLEYMVLKLQAGSEG